MEGWRKRREAGWERKGGRGGGTKERRGRKDSLPERPLSLVSFPYIPAVKLPSEEYKHPDFIGARGGGCSVKRDRLEFSGPGLLLIFVTWPIPNLSPHPSPLVTKSWDMSGDPESDD